MRRSEPTPGSRSVGAIPRIADIPRDRLHRAPPIQPRRNPGHRPALGAGLLHVLTLPDFDRVGAVQSHWGNPATRIFGELLIDREEDRTLRAVLVRLLGETDR